MPYGDFPGCYCPNCVPRRPPADLGGLMPLHPDDGQIRAWSEADRALVWKAPEPAQQDLAEFMPPPPPVRWKQYRRTWWGKAVETPESVLAGERADAAAMEYLRIKAHLKATKRYPGL